MSMEMSGTVIDGRTASIMFNPPHLCLYESGTPSQYFFGSCTATSHAQIALKSIPACMARRLFCQALQSQNDLVGGQFYGTIVMDACHMAKLAH